MKLDTFNDLIRSAEERAKDQGDVDMVALCAAIAELGNELNKDLTEIKGRLSELK